jgi:hypothetical protein
LTGESLRDCRLCGAELRRIPFENDAHLARIKAILAERLALRRAARDAAAAGHT